MPDLDLALINPDSEGCTAWSTEFVRFEAMPAMGAGFGNVGYREVARQMAVAYENYLDPPLALDWDSVVRVIPHDGAGHGG